MKGDYRVRQGSLLGVAQAGPTAQELADQIGIEKLRLLPRDPHQGLPRRERALAERTESAVEEIARLEKEIDVFTRLKVLRAAKAELIEQLALGAAPAAYPRLTAIAQHCLKYSGYKLRDLKGPGRTARLCSIRFAYYREAHKAGFSLADIGRFVNRDHGTVSWGLRSKS